MRNIWLAATTVILVLFVLTSLTMALPKMFISHDIFDFGYVPQNSKVSHVFWLKSVGEDSLKVLKVTPG